MSNNELPPNVTPIRPPPSLSIEQDGRPYTTPSAAVEDALKFHGFNEAVVGAGKVEIRIIAEFQKDGALFHHIQASHVQPAPAQPEPAGNVTPSAKPAPAAAPPAPSASGASVVLKAMARGTSGMRPVDFIIAATLEEMTILDEEFAGITEDEAISWLHGPSDLQEIVESKYPAPRSRAIIERLFEEA